MPSASASDSRIDLGSLTAWAPQYTPWTAMFFTSGRFSGSFGTMPLAKPSTMTLPPHRTHRSPCVNPSPPTGSSKTSTPLKDFNPSPPFRALATALLSPAKSSRRPARIPPPSAECRSDASMQWSAPASRNASILRTPLAAATTTQPNALAICTAARPTPPAAPKMSTVEPFVTRAYRVRAKCAVPNATGKAAACARVTPSGTGKTEAALATVSSAMAPPPMVTPATRSPILTPERTFAPHSVTTPANSPPGMNGSRGFS